MNSIKQFSIIVAVILGILLIVVITLDKSKTDPEKPQGETKVQINIPYVIKGYYEPFEKRMEYDGEFYGTTTCDTFVVTKEDNPLLSYMRELVENGNTINRLTSDGKLRLNINLGDVNEQLKNYIKKSSITEHIDIEMQLIEVDGKENTKCGSFLKIVN